MSFNVNEFLKSIECKNYLFAFVYGSHLYHPEYVKDIDIMIVHDKESYDVEDSYQGYNLDLHYVNKNNFQIRIKNHDIISLEGLSLQFHEKYENLWSGKLPFINIERNRLRRSISSKCSNSFVKSKKKITVEEDRDLYCSMKSLYHSIRMYDFGIQLADTGYIYNYESCKKIYEALREEYNVKDHSQILSLIREKYKPLFNDYASMFRKYCPK